MSEEEERALEEISWDQEIEMLDQMDDDELVAYLLAEGRIHNEI